MATKITPAQSKSLQSQISQIQAGINQVVASRSSQPTPQAGDRYKGTGPNLIDASKRVVELPNGQTLTGEAAMNYGKSSVPVGKVDTPITPEEQVDTTQPSPQKVDATPFTKPTVPYQQAVEGLRSGGAFSGSQLATEEENLAATYRRAGMLAQQTGVPSPQDAGAGAHGAGMFMDATSPQRNEAPTAWTDVYELSPGVDKDFLDYDAWMSPLNQKQTLKEEYESLKSTLTIGGKTAEQLDMEMIDAEAVINGTEDDIRNEITAAGGIATDSQVQALAIARNKSLIKNYDKLVSMRKSLDTQLSTTMELSMKDRELASAEFDRKIGWAEKVMQFVQTSKNNSRSGFNSMVSNIGYDGLYSTVKDNPYDVSLIEKSLGLPSGGLQKAATFATTQRKAVEVPLGGISATTQAIINNPSLFDDLTPTEKGKVITQLQGAGYDTTNLGLKGLSDTAIQNVAQTQKALDDLAILRSKIQGNESKLGPITGLAALNPWSEARKIQADADRVRQTVGKALEGGVLRKEDEEKYKKILATLTDTPSTAYYKIDALIGSISRDIETYKSLQQSAGRSMNVTGSLQKAGSSTSIENLRAKYNY